MVIEHPQLKYEIEIPFTNSSQLSGMLILNSIEKVIQSNQNVSLDNSFKIQVGAKKMFEGGVNICKRKKYNSVVELIIKKKCIINLENTDNLCLFRSTSILIADLEQAEYRIKIRRNNSILQTTKAIDLKNLIQFNKTENADLIDLKKLETALAKYQFLVIDAETDFEFVYVGPEKTLKIFLLNYKNHFYPITSMPSFYNANHFCEKCLKPYNVLYANHKCNTDFCNLCKQKSCFYLKQNQKQQIECFYCQEKCNSEKCLISHQNLTCKQILLCTECRELKSKNHVCKGKKNCSNCKSIYKLEEDHQCFIQIDDLFKNKKKLFGYIFFDYETMTSDDQENKHIPILIVAKKCCLECSDSYDLATNQTTNLSCSVCDTFIFEKNDEFCLWALKQENFIFIAHNMGRFDCYFIMNYLINNYLPGDPLLKPLIKGSRILALTYGNVKFIDSFNFISDPLKTFSKTFSIQNPKGNFPHLFSKQNNLNYVGPLPDLDYYDIHNMQEKEKDEFIEWYNLHRNDVFNFRQELLFYCNNDVELLMKGCLSLRKILIESSKSVIYENGLDPFKYTISLPSFCHLLYRTKLMKPNTILVIPEINRFKIKSNKCIIWLKYLAMKNNINLQYETNGGEKKIGPYKIDGYDRITHIGYEFHGW